MFCNFPNFVVLFGSQYFEVLYLSLFVKAEYWHFFPLYRWYKSFKSFVHGNSQKVIAPVPNAYCIVRYNSNNTVLNKLKNENLANSFWVWIRVGKFLPGGKGELPGKNRFLALGGKLTETNCLKLLRAYDTTFISKYKRKRKKKEKKHFSCKQN